MAWRVKVEWEEPVARIMHDPTFHISLFSLFWRWNLYFRLITVTVFYNVMMLVSCERSQNYAWSHLSTAIFCLFCLFFCFVFFFFGFLVFLSFLSFSQRGQWPELCMIPAFNSKAHISLFSLFFLAKSLVQAISKCNISCPHYKYVKPGSMLKENKIWMKMQRKCFQRIIVFLETIKDME